MIWVYCNTLNVVLVNSSQKDIDLEALDYVGMAIMVIGLGYEVIGDQQKQAWKNSEASKGAVLCDVGLWGHTRHPNYFGEMFFWIGAFISSLPVVTREDDYFYIAVLSPIITILILLFLGGLPTAEGSSLKKYYKDEECVNAKVGRIQLPSMHTSCCLQIQTNVARIQAAHKHPFPLSTCFVCSTSAVVQACLLLGAAYV